MLKETRNSLRFYFVIVAAFSIFSGTAGAVQGGRSPLVMVFALTNIVFGVLFAYIVVKFSKLLSKKPGFIKNVLTANLAVSVIDFGLPFLSGLQPVSIFGLLITSLIYYYLVKSVARLSVETALHTS